MSVFKENGSWFVRYRDLEGKQREKKAGATKALALELERKILAERDLKKRFGYTTLKEITFSDWLDQYLERIKINLKFNSSRNKILFFNRLKSFCGEKLLSQLTEKDFLDFFKTNCRNGLKSKGIETYKKHIHSCLKEAKEANYNVANIIIKINYKQKIRVRYLTEEEIQLLLSNCSTSQQKLLLVMALNTGMRKNEMLNLLWKDIDLTTRLIHIEESKSDERRSVPINNVLLSALNSAEKKSEKVFFDSTLQTWVAKFQVYLKKCGIKNFRFHDLRHTFASWLAIKGVSLYTIKELLGHKSIEMTQRYAHLSPDVRFNAVSLLTFC